MYFRLMYIFTMGIGSSNQIIFLIQFHLHQYNHFQASCNDIVTLICNHELTKTLV